MSLGYDPELPAGLQDADIEMRELEQAARQTPARPHLTRGQGVSEKAVTMKDGTTVPKGSPVQFIKEHPEKCYVQGARFEAYRVKVSSAFTPPSMEELEESVSDGVCDSVLGEPVEPDGWDCHGSPSWLLALGMI